MIKAFISLEKEEGQVKVKGLYCEGLKEKTFDNILSLGLYLNSSRNILFSNVKNQIRFL